MNTLEEEVVIPLKRHMAALEKKTLSKFGFWSIFFIVGLGFIFGAAAGGLFLMKNELNSSWQQAIASYDWLVLAEGDPIAMDEVGAYLKKLDGASDVVYVPSEEIFEKAKLDISLSANLALLEGNPFPSAWKVHWNAEDFTPDHIQGSLTDVRSFPGVIDVASDPMALEKIHYFRTLLLRAKLALSLMVSAIIVVLLIAIGRLAFWVWPSKLSGKTLFLGGLFGALSVISSAALLFLLW